MIHKADFIEIEGLMPILGYHSVSQFVQEATREKLVSARYQAERRLADIANKEKQKYEEGL